MKLFNNIVISSRSERERERERESSLSSLSLKFKKSFTLIELSIVLLILSLLVGSLLVGRQIVDRAKIQRIIFEFDYYEKAFHQFYDTYRFVPGNLSEKNCLKYPEFQVRSDACTGYRTTAGNSWVVKTTNPASRLIPVKHRTHCFLMKQMVASKLVDKSLAGVEPTIKNGGGCVDRVGAAIGQDYQTGSNIGQGNVVHASFDKNVEIDFFGFPNNFGSDATQLTYAKQNVVQGANIYMNPSMPHEFDNISFRSTIAGHNVIMATAYLLNIGYASGGTMASHPYGAFNANIASALDAKIDDGRPGTGRLLGLKGAFAFAKKGGVKSTSDEHMAVCYDKMANDVDKAIYHTTRDMKYGCNIFKIMEDLK